MKISKTIPRRNAKDNPYSYHSLRREGIELAQDFSGKNWTDYNAHDPGVTILEQLCYGLTDSIYRTEFDVADYLVNENNQLDLDYLSLIPAEKILPCRPCTLEDYHQAIIDDVEEIERLWITLHTCDTHSAYSGLYVIEIQLTPLAQERCNARANLKLMIIEKVARVYAGLRNLSEDVAEIRITEQNNYQLISDIEIARHVDANEVLADIYFVTNQWFKDLLGCDDSIQSYEELLAAGQSIEQIFDGPTTRYSKHHQNEVNHTKSVAALYAAIQALPSITRINQLNLLSLMDDAKLAKSVNDRASLAIPKQHSEIKIVLRQGEQPVALNFLNFNNRYQHKLFKTETIRHTRQETDSLYQRPTGQFKRFERYYSIQNNFPIAYHLSVQSVSSSITVNDLAKTKQLRGYLTVFEQFLANFNANITGIRSLFSKDISSGQSYHFNYIDNKKMTGIEALYVDNARQKLPELLAKFDLFEERKSHVLDYLLALYGETLSLPLLSQFHEDETQPIAHKVIEQKAAYLSSIIGVTKDRGGAFDYTRQFSNANTGGFYNRLAFHLGLNIQQSNQPNLRCCESLKNFSLTLVPNGQDKSLFIQIDNNKIDTLFDAHAVQPAQIGNYAIFKTLISHLKLFKNNTINESLLIHGMNRNRYKLLPVDKNKADDKQTFDIVFNGDYLSKNSSKKPAKKSSWLHIAQTSNKERAHQLVNLFIQFITYVNQTSEHFHLVEHLLLRSDNQLIEHDVDDDLSCQISVVMPNYTQRFANVQYQQQAEQEVHTQCPSHILANVYWVDYPTMMIFENLYFEWLGVRQSQVICSQESTDAGQALMIFMRDQSLKKSQEQQLEENDSTAAQCSATSESY